MMRSAITISLVEEARGGPFVFWHDLPGAIRTAAEMGFDAIEIFPPSSTALDVTELSQHLRFHGLQVAALGTGAGWVKHKLTLTNPDPSQRRDAITFVREIIATAAQFNAPAIIGSMQGRAADNSQKPTALEFLAESLNELGEYAGSLGQVLLYEPLNRYETNLVNTVEDAVMLLKRLSNGHVKLLCDLFHMNIEEVNIADSLRTAGQYLGHVHFVDSNRRAAGFGHLVYEPIADALRAIQYAGYLSAEVLPLPNSESAAKQTIQQFQRLFR